jgi:Tfp pilus assembly protein PilO
MDKKININKNSYIYGILILALIISVVVGFLVIRPISQDNKKQQQILDNRNKVTKTLEDKKNKLSKLSEDEKKLKEMVEEVDKSIPMNQDVKTVATQLFLMAFESGVGVDSIDLAVSSGVAEEQALVPVITGANEIRFTVSGKSSYPNIVKFLDKIKNSLRLMNVDNIGITGTDKDSLDYSFILTTYTRGEVASDEQL